MSSNLVYISADGTYGEANGLVILDLDDLGDDGKIMLREAFDDGQHLQSWFRKQFAAIGFPVQTYTVEGSGFILNKLSVTFGESVIDGSFDREQERKAQERSESISAAIEKYGVPEVKQRRKLFGRRDLKQGE
jgi:hypothetical protein